MNFFHDFSRSRREIRMTIKIHKLNNSTFASSSDGDEKLKKITISVSVSVFNFCSFNFSVFFFQAHITRLNTILHKNMYFRCDNTDLFLKIENRFKFISILGFQFFRPRFRFQFSTGAFDASDFR